MNGLLISSKENRMPIELIYIASTGDISYRKILVTEIKESYIKAYCFTRRQTRTFKRSNILAAAKPRKHNRIAYA